MTLPRRCARRAVTSASAAALIAAPLALAAQDTQVTLSLDAGVATVAYDEFLRSGVGTLTPAVRVERGRVTFSARGAYSRFLESRNHSIEGAASAAVISPAYRHVRGELFGTASNTRYSGHADAATNELTDAATNVLAVGRLHWASASHGLWLGTGLGGVTQGFFLPNGFVQLDLGGWMRASDATFTMQVLPSRIGPKRYTDAVASARWEPARGEITASAGLRRGERANGARQWAEVGAGFWFTRHLAIVGGVGVFPAELWRGLPGGRYASTAVRVASRAPQSADPRRLAALTAPYELGSLRRPRAVARQFALVTENDGTRTLRFRVPRASHVELMGDFSDWSPIALTPGDGEFWTLNVFLSPGVHRLNVRVDGGPWIAPPGLTVVRDDFGGAVGILVVQ